MFEHRYNDSSQYSGCSPGMLKCVAQRDDREIMSLWKSTQQYINSCNLKFYS